MRPDVLGGGIRQNHDPAGRRKFLLSCEDTQAGSFPQEDVQDHQIHLARMGRKPCDGFVFRLRKGFDVKHRALLDHGNQDVSDPDVVFDEVKRAAVWARHERTV